MQKRTPDKEEYLCDHSSGQDLVITNMPDPLSCLLQCLLKATIFLTFMGITALLFLTSLHLSMPPKLYGIAFFFLLSSFI